MWFHANHLNRSLHVPWEIKTNPRGERETVLVSKTSLVHAEHSLWPVNKADIKDAVSFWGEPIVVFNYHETMWVLFYLSYGAGGLEITGNYQG